MGLFGNKDKPVKLNISGKYFGSHPELHGQNFLFLTFEESGVTVPYKKEILRSFTWDEIVGFDTNTESQSQSSQRVTATRMLALGVFSLAAQKKTGSVKAEMNDVLHTTTGDIELENEAAGGDPKSLNGSITGFVIAQHERNAKKIKRFVAERAKGVAPKTESSSLSAADELEKYAKLKKNGAITQAEFDAAKKLLLGL